MFLPVCGFLLVSQVVNDSSKVWGICKPLFINALLANNRKWSVVMNITFMQSGFGHRSHSQ